MGTSAAAMTTTSASATVTMTSAVLGVTAWYYAMTTALGVMLQ